MDAKSPTMDLPIVLREHIELYNGRVAQYQLLRAKFDFCVEAFKPMEADFTEILKSVGGMTIYQKTVMDLQKFVVLEVKRLAVSVECTKWWYDVPFGVFCSAMSRLISLELDNKEKRLRLSSLIKKGLQLLQQVLAEGVGMLEREGGAFLNDPTFVSTLEFMKQEENLILVVREFACIARKKAERDTFSHPFENLGFAGEKNATIDLAIDAYSAILNEVYAECFRNVGLLCLFRLQIQNQKDLKQRQKALEKMDVDFKMFLMEVAGCDRQ